MRGESRAGDQQEATLMSHVGLLCDFGRTKEVRTSELTVNIGLNNRNLLISPRHASRNSANID